MPGGPPRTPTTIRKARGNPGHQRNEPLEPQPMPTTADPPLDLTGIALKLWHELAPEFVRMGTLTVVDRNELATGCRLRAIGLARLETWGEDNAAAQMATLSILRDSSRILGRFGVGASDRTRIHVQLPPGPGKWAVAS